MSLSSAVTPCVSYGAGFLALYNLIPALYPSATEPHLMVTAPKRVLSSVHSMLTVYQSFNIFLKAQEEPKDQKKIDLMIKHFFIHQLGYYTFDNIWMAFSLAKLRDGSIADVVHHVVCFLASIQGVTHVPSPKLQQVFPGVLLFVSLMMAPQSILNTQWLIENLAPHDALKGPKKPNMYLAALFALTWFLVRVASFPVIFYWFSKNQKLKSLSQIPTSMPKKCVLGSALFFSLNVYWLWKIVAWTLLKQRGANITMESLVNARK